MYVFLLAPNPLMHRYNALKQQLNLGFYFRLLNPDTDLDTLPYVDPDIKAGDFAN